MKRAKSESRQDILDDGQAYEGFEFKGRKHKPLTGGGLKFLQRINSALFTNEYDNASEFDLMIEYLFATSATPSELKAACNQWDDIQFEFASEYTMKDLSDPIIVNSITRDLTNQAGASFEVKVEETGKKISSEILPIGS